MMLPFRRLRPVMLVCLLSLAFPSGDAFGQVLSPRSSPLDTSTFRFRRLGTEQGLAQNTVLDVLQDKRGFLWIATGDGLCRWNGYNVKTWRHDPKDSTSLSNFHTTDLLQDTHGDIWVSTLDGLNRFDTKTGKFERYYAPNRFQTNQWTTNGGATDRLLAKGDTLYALTNLGLCIVNRRTKTLEPVPCTDGSDSIIQRYKSGFSFLSVQYPPLANKDCLYLFANNYPSNYVFRYFEYNIHTRHYSLKNFYPPKEMLPEFDRAEYKRVWLIDYKGSCWIEYRNRLNTKASVLHWHPKEFGGTGVMDKHSIVLTNVASLINPHSDSRHQIWLLHDFLLDIVDSSYQHIQHRRIIYNPRDTTSIASPQLIHLGFAEYAPGKHWLGSDGGGVNFLLSPEKFPKYQPFTAPMCWAMAEDGYHKLWVSTFATGGSGKGGINSYDLKTGAVEKYLGDENFYYLFRDSHDNIWGGHVRGSFYKLIPTNGGRRNIVRYPFPICAIYSMVEDRFGMLWIGAKSTTNVLYRFNPHTGRITHTFQNMGVILSLDRKGRIWAGENGVTVFDPADADSIRFYGQDSTPHLFTRYVNDPKNPRSLGNDVVKCFHEADNGTMWIATITGLDHLDPKTNTFRHYTEADGMPNNYTYGILPDNAGNLWVSTNRGLSRFNPKTGAWRNYSPADGLQSYEFDRLSFCTLRDGRLVFGGVNGFNIFRPEDVQDNTTPPPVAIVDIAVNDRPWEQVLKNFTPNTAQYGIREVSELTTLELGYNDNTLTFDFAALDYTDPARNLYAYKMDGVDKDWVQAGTLRKTRYAGLPPGDYVFRVKACNNDGVWNEEGTSLRICITPPFWRTWWFTVLAIALTLGSTVSITRFSLRRRLTSRLEKERLEQQIERERLEKALELERERRRISQDIHDEVGSGLTKILMLSQNAADGITQPNEEISNTAQGVIDGMQEIIWSINPKNDTLQSLVAFIRSYGREFVSAGGINFVVDTPEELAATPLRTDVRRNVFLAVKEALNNAVKYSAATEIRIRLEVQSGAHIFTITDNGKGFVWNDSAESLPTVRGGNGLENMRLRMEEIGGSFRLDSVPNEGTTIVLQIPR